MNLPNIEFSRFAVYLFLFLAVILFSFFRILGRVAPLLPVKKEKRRTLTRYLPVLEIFAWGFFFIWTIQYFWKNNQMYSVGLFLILVLLLLWVAWFVLKDFIAGAVFRANSSFKIQDTVQIEEYTGKIIDFRSRNIVIETGNGETIYYPYSKVLGKVIIKSIPAEMIRNKTIFLTISKDKSLIDTISNIRTDILNLPWSSIKKEPQIKPITENIDSFELEIVIFALETEYFYKIESYIKENYSIN